MVECGCLDSVSKASSGLKLIPVFYKFFLNCFFLRSLAGFRLLFLPPIAGLSLRFIWDLTFLLWLLLSPPTWSGFGFPWNARLKASSIILLCWLMTPYFILVNFNGGCFGCFDGIGKRISTSHSRFYWASFCFYFFCLLRFLDLVDTDTSKVSTLRRSSDFSLYLSNFSWSLSLPISYSCDGRLIAVMKVSYSLSVLSLSYFFFLCLASSSLSEPSAWLSSNVSATTWRLLVRSSSTILTAYSWSSFLSYSQLKPNFQLFRLVPSLMRLISPTLLPHWDHMRTNLSLPQVV